ncbi:MAG: type II toxin-antitoxin system VapC family toxin [Anaerolineales bacterium]|nr:type II toxin-antitoxin system VapC family toxin [Anaerolineales bacterium]MCA9995443.1 type II toxin-antitoxin system VapC family toxin [Anaerolineales bacterium]
MESSVVGDCVVDASVGIKLFLVEEGSDAADRLFAELSADPPARFYVPDLFFVECGNILWKYVRHFGYDAASARQDVADLQALRLQTVSTADLLTPAFELALQYGLTAYDASYAALAQQLSLPLITSDAPLVRTLADSSIDVRLLTNLFDAM